MIAEGFLSYELTSFELFLHFRVFVESTRGVVGATREDEGLIILSLTTFLLDVGVLFSVPLIEVAEVPLYIDVELVVFTLSNELGSIMQLIAQL